jgi:radical SAM superfamily enzyme YgiQ (UPF0313 family)
MMKVLFVYTREAPQSPSKPLVDLEAIQFGISYVSAHLKVHGHQTRLLVMTRASDFAEVDRLMKEFVPQVVCFTAVASEYLFIRKIAEYIRKGYPDRYLVLGGVHASLHPEEAMLDRFDALCIGEGEQPTVELVEQLQRRDTPSGIANLWIKRGDKIEKNPPREFAHDLDALPFADREIWFEWLDLARSPMRPSLLLGRGCPFVCTYCCNHALRKLAAGQYVRLRSPKNVVAEIESILQHMPQVREIYFEVETLGANIEWTLAFCCVLEQFNAARPQPLSFGGNLRVTPALKSRFDELFLALRNANFRFVNIGLESGSPRLRSEVLRRHYANEDIIQAVAAARKHGLQVIFYNLIGLPTETLADLDQTIEVNRVCQPDYHYLSIFYPYPGTELYTLCDVSGWLPRDLLASGKERVRATIDYPTLRRSQIDKAFLWFDAYAFAASKPPSWHTARLWEMYKFAYEKPGRILWALTKDVLRPSLRLRPGTPELRLYLGVLRRQGNKACSKVWSKVRSGAYQIGVSLARRSASLARHPVATGRRVARALLPRGVRYCLTGLGARRRPASSPHGRPASAVTRPSLGRSSKPWRRRPATGPSMPGSHATAAESSTKH